MVTEDKVGIADRLDALMAELKAATPAVIAKTESLLPREFPAPEIRLNTLTLCPTENRTIIFFVFFR